MKTTEQLAVLTALQKMVKGRLDEVRREADDDLLDAYDEDGVTKRALKIGGVKVGDHIVVMTTGTWEIEDSAAFEEFALDYGIGTIERSIKPEYIPRVLEILVCELPEAIEETVKLDPKWQSCLTNTGGVATFMDSGLRVPGVTYVGQQVKNTQVRGCKPEDVAPIIASLGGIDALLLPEQPTIKSLNAPEEG